MRIVTAVAIGVAAGIASFAVCKLFEMTVRCIEEDDCGMFEDLDEVEFKCRDTDAPAEKSEDEDKVSEL